MDLSELQKCIEEARAARARAWGVFSEGMRVCRFAQEVREQVAERREQTRRLLSPLNG